MIEKILNYEKQLRIGIILSMLVATVFVVTSAFTDLYSPGSAIARQYSDIATLFLFLTVIMSLPLWYKKIEAIESWVSMMEGKGGSVRLKVICKAVAPMIITIVYALILTIIISGIIYYYDLLPVDVIAKYKAYYAPINYSNISIIGYPNTSIDWQP